MGTRGGTERARCAVSRANTPEAATARGRATVATILDEAIRAFGELGYHGASVRGIAARAGVSHPSLLRYFPSKAALLRSALEHRDALDDAAFAVDLARGVEFVEALVAVMQRNEARRPLVEALAGSAAQGAAPGHPAHEHMRRRYARLVARMHEALQELERDDRLAAGVDPKAAARVIVALMDGLQVQWLYSLDASGPRPLDMAAHLGTYLRLVTE